MGFCGETRKEWSCPLDVQQVRTLPAAPVASAPLLWMTSLFTVQIISSCLPSRSLCIDSSGSDQDQTGHQLTDQSLLCSPTVCVVGDRKRAHLIEKTLLSMYVLFFFFDLVQWCRSRTVRRRSSTAGRAAPQGCGPSCGPSSSTPPTSRRCDAHLHTHAARGVRGWRLTLFVMKQAQLRPFPTRPVYCWAFQSRLFLSQVLTGNPMLKPNRGHQLTSPASVKPSVLAPLLCITAGCASVHMFKHEGNQMPGDPARQFKQSSRLCKMAESRLSCPSRRRR